MYGNLILKLLPVNRVDHRFTMSLIDVVCSIICVYELLLCQEYKVVKYFYLIFVSFLWVIRCNIAQKFREFSELMHYSAVLCFEGWTAAMNAHSSLPEDSSGEYNNIGIA